MSTLSSDNCRMQSEVKRQHNLEEEEDDDDLSSYLVHSDIRSYRSVIKLRKSVLNTGKKRGSLRGSVLDLLPQDCLYYLLEWCDLSTLMNLSCCNRRLYFVVVGNDKLWEAKSALIRAAIERVHSEKTDNWSLSSFVFEQSVLFHELSKFEQCMAYLLEYLVCSAENGESSDWNMTSLFRCSVNTKTTLLFGHIHPGKVSEIDGSMHGPNILSLARMRTQFYGTFLLSHVLQSAQLVTCSSDLDVIVTGLPNPVRPEGGWRPIFEKLCAELNADKKEPMWVWRDCSTAAGGVESVLIFGSKKGMFFNWKIIFYRRRRCNRCGRG